MLKGRDIIFLFIIILISCKDDDDAFVMEDPPIPIVPIDTTPKGPKDSLTPYQLEFPVHFTRIPAPIIPRNNPLTVEGIALGKKLFYEKKLSKNNQISCGDCHKPEFAFNDKDNALSQGVNGTLGVRNAMPLFNLAWVSVSTKKFNWHGSANTLEKQAIEPVINAKEMQENWSNVVKKLQQDLEYPAMFHEVFGNDTIDSTMVLKAIAQFERTLISANSRVDKYVLEVIEGIDVPGNDFLSAQELRGYNLYIDEGKGDCFHCHGTFNNPLWTDNKMVNNGLDFSPDSGFASVTKNPNDLGKFKVPSLRNLVFTGPYMHDGRFSTLREVIDFYADNVKLSSPNVDPSMAKSRNLNNQEREDIIAFLKALTDSSFVNDPKFRP